MPQRPKHLKPCPELPNLRKKNHDVTSDIDPRYNCIAYAAGITNRKYWPVWAPDCYWPPNVPMVVHVDAFVRLYETFGYALIGGPPQSNYRSDVERIAIFATADGKPTHAARELGPNKWASKLGNSFDIEHQQSAVTGGLYGEVILYMGRPR